MSHQLSSNAYSASNVSETTLVDTSKATTSPKPGLEQQQAPKPSLKKKIMRKLDGSVDPTKKPADPSKSWEARATPVARARSVHWLPVIITGIIWNHAGNENIRQAAPPLLFVCLCKRPACWERRHQSSLLDRRAIWTSELSRALELGLAQFGVFDHLVSSQQTHKVAIALHGGGRSNNV
ncbi:hypothetical protein FZEAL_2818 [Fusarium zealandicum]|uniref:Uncharacterized protein n=1 Tax=Fusarium zealandicum TaxID=1053134 RepID=A0A8H4UQ39_9HYPO|nr:hypothetical protein FZEAL_2818 [Fusarium zealandicum]